VRRSAPGQGADGSGEELVCISNFAAVPHDGYRVGLPSEGVWEEVVNTDADAYAGSGVGNLGTVTAVSGDHHGWPAYADLRVPPLGTLWLRRRPRVVEPASEESAVTDDAAVAAALDQDPQEDIPTA